MVMAGGYAPPLEVVSPGLARGGRDSTRTERQVPTLTLCNIAVDFEEWRACLLGVARVTRRPPAETAGRWRCLAIPSGRCCTVPAPPDTALRRGHSVGRAMQRETTL